MGAISDLYHGKKTKESIKLRFILIAAGAVIGFIVGLVSTIAESSGDFMSILISPLIGILGAIGGALAVICGVTLLMAFVFYWKTYIGTIFKATTVNLFMIAIFLGIFIAFYQTCKKYIPILFKNLVSVFTDYKYLKEGVELPDENEDEDI